MAQVVVAGAPPSPRAGGPRPAAWSARFEGEPALWVPSAISGDGAVSALLVEPRPDASHLNNRSGELLVFGGAAAGPAPAYTISLAGMGPTDPQSVAVTEPESMRSDDGDGAFSSMSF